MSSSALGPLSAKVIALIMMKNENFCKYDLSNNDIGDKGIIEIGKALASHGVNKDEYIGASKRIISLNVSSNSITSKGFDVFITFLELNESLIELDISSNSK